MQVQQPCARAPAAHRVFMCELTVNGQESQEFQEGDRIRIVKKESTVLNDLAVVKDPNWNGLIKVELVEGEDKGETKAYKPSDMVLVTSTQVERKCLWNVLEETGGVAGVTKERGTAERGRHQTTPFCSIIEVNFN